MTMIGIIERWIVNFIIVLISSGAILQTWTMMNPTYSTLIIRWWWVWLAIVSSQAFGITVGKPNISHFLKNHPILSAFPVILILTILYGIVIQYPLEAHYITPTTTPTPIATVAPTPSETATSTPTETATPTPTPTVTSSPTPIANPCDHYQVPIAKIERDGNEQAIATGTYTNNPRNAEYALVLISEELDNGTVWGESLVRQFDPGNVWSGRVTLRRPVKLKIIPAFIRRNMEGILKEKFNGKTRLSDTDLDHIIRCDDFSKPHDNSPSR